MMLESWAGTAGFNKHFSEHPDGKQFRMPSFPSLHAGEQVENAAGRIQVQRLFMRCCAYVWMILGTMACVQTVPGSSNLHTHLQLHRALLALYNDIKKTQEQTSEGTFAPLHLISPSQIQNLASHCRRVFDYMQPWKDKHVKCNKTRGRSERSLHDHMSSYCPLVVVLPDELKGRLGASVAKALRPFGDADVALRVWGVQLIHRGNPVNATALVPANTPLAELDAIFAVAPRARRLLAGWKDSVARGLAPEVDARDDAWVVATLLLIDAAVDPKELLQTLPARARDATTLAAGHLAECRSYGKQVASRLLADGLTGRLTPLPKEVGAALVADVLKELIANARALGFDDAVLAALRSASAGKPLKMWDVASAAGLAYQALTQDGQAALAVLVAGNRAKSQAAAQAKKNKTKPAPKRPASTQAPHPPKRAATAATAGARGSTMGEGQGQDQSQGEGHGQGLHEGSDQGASGDLRDGDDCESDCESDQQHSEVTQRPRTRSAGAGCPASVACDESTDEEASAEDVSSDESSSTSGEDSSS